MTNDKQTDQITAAISHLIKQIKYLGGGDEQEHAGWGAIECLTREVGTVGNGIGDAIEDVAVAIRELTQVLSKDKSE